MAFNHVGGCDCPVGNCDCGVNYTEESFKRKCWNKINELTPKDVFMVKSSGEIVEYNRDQLRNKSSNIFKIGQVDEELTKEGCAEKLFTFHAFMIVNEIPEGLHPSMMDDLIRRMRDASKKDQVHKWAVNKIKPLYMVPGRCTLWGSN